MNKLKQIVLILACAYLLGFNQTKASPVFKCIDEQGVTTFAFAPCPAKKQNTKNVAEPEMTLEQQLSQLDKVDNEIARINGQFREARFEYEDQLLQTSEIKARAELRRDYQRRTQQLLDTLNGLKSERGEIIEGSFSLISQQSVTVTTD